MRTASKHPTSRGLWVALLGPDGVGKSAVIEELQRRFQPSFDGVTLFHFRPGFRRCAVDRPPVTRPHAAPPRSMLVSVFKLLYWLVDCWYGYLVVIRPRRRSQGLIIFDRYYPDILVDPIRYRLPKQSAKIARWLTGLAPRPDLYVLLDASAEIVHQRKAELPLAELRRQRGAYLKLFDGMHRKLLVNANDPVLEVAHSISAALHSFCSETHFPRPESSLVAGQ